MYVYHTQTHKIWTMYACIVCFGPYVTECNGIG